MDTEQTIVPVTMRAVCQRIGRKLTANNGGELHPVKVRKARGERARQNVGKYFIVKGDIVIASGIDPEAYGRELGVVRAFETVVG